MKRLIPTTITESDLVSTSVSITETAWSGAESCDTGDRRYKGRYLYEAAKDNVSSDPETHAGGVSVNKDWLLEFSAVEEPDWLVVGMINRWKLFDSYVTTYTEDEDVVTVVFYAPYTETLYFLGMYASALAIQILNAGDEVIWSTVVDLMATDDPADEWEWCWTQIPEPKSEFGVRLGLITSETDKIKITVYGA